MIFRIYKHSPLKSNIYIGINKGFDGIRRLGIFIAIFNRLIVLMVRI
jgi:hypothetical protein